MVGVGDLNHALVELREVFKEAAGVEEQFLFQQQAALLHGATDGRECSLAHSLLVVEQPENLVQIAGIDRLGNPGHAAGLEHTGDFAQGLIHMFHRHVMQRLEHQHDIDTVVVGRNGLGTAVAETHRRQVGNFQIAGILDAIDLQRHDLARSAGFRQQAGLLGPTAAQFENCRCIERQFIEHQSDFVDQVGLVGIGDFHGASIRER
ncbi:hypothetical protein SDC9_179538 [bioreactor metagenome]|uniref:Uncharacterized protein n=1 Tax=bioreactor metagenome TaxID=1076179 RepID=A0A645H165_9ZZZZ